MPAPSTNVSIISASELVSGAPIFVTHPIKLNDSVNNVDEQVSYGFTRAQAHDHDGVNSEAITLATISGTVSESQLGSSIVSRGKLKTGQEEKSVGVAGAGSTSFALASVGEYGFQAEMKSTFYTGTLTVSMSGTGAYEQRIKVDYSGAPVDTVYARIRYVQASPPWTLGGIPWGHAPWVWLLRRLSDGEVIRGACADDPCWWLRYPGHYPKGDFRAMIDMPAVPSLGIPARPGRPHPFAEDLPEMPPGSEVVLLDLRHLDEMVDHRPAKIRHEAMVADRLTLIGRGIQEHELRAQERASERAMLIEEAGFRAAAQALAGLADEREQLLRAIARSSQLGEDRKDVLRSRLDSMVRAKEESLRQRLPLRRRWHIMREENCRGFLDCVIGANSSIGSLPGRSMSEDRAHPDHKRLPPMDGLFRAGRDGSPPKVRVLTP